MDWRASKSGKDEKLTSSLENISHKLHALTWHNFHDHVYDIKDPKSVYFFQAKNAERERQKKKATLNRKLNKLLSVKEFSHVSGLVSHLGLFVEPFICVVYGYLSAFRAFFNLTTWQDPYLTFLLSIVISIATLVLFLIPWRPVLFALGVWFVGPQNLAIRKLRERGTLPPLKRKEHKEVAEEPVVPKKECVLHTHKRLHGITKPPEGHPDFDPLEVQHIVVPYNHFMYQRFYSWPPENQYATVTPAKSQRPLLERELTAISLSNRSATTGTAVGGKPGARFPRFQRLRRRPQPTRKKNG